MTNSNIIRALIKRRLEEPDYSLNEVKEILGHSVVESYEMEVDETPFLLFAPGASLWVLLTDRHLVYRNGRSYEKIPIKKINGDYLYDRQLKPMCLGVAEFKYDNLDVSWKNKWGIQKHVSVPIEVGAIYAFVDSLGFLMERAKPGQALPR